MLTRNINFKNFKVKKNNKDIKKDLISLLTKKNMVLKSLGDSYKNNYTKKILLKFKKYTNIRIIGMGGSILGTKSIYDFLKNKVKKNFYFIDNLQSKIKFNDKKNYLNLIISKSGNTLETISNSNIIIKNNKKNIFITENKKSYLYLLAQN